MFTGLIETVGRVVEIGNEPPGKRFEIDSGNIVEGVEIGDSIAVNGCCLTVVQIDGPRLGFEAGSETLSRTNLGELDKGSSVNLERALSEGDRLGGHYVTGHVDAIAILSDRQDDRQWSHFRFSVPKRFMSQIASKGSVAVDGVSLTVVDVSEDSFSVALIPHTLHNTTLGGRSIGARINLETDLLAKYVERSIEVLRNNFW